MLLKERIVLNCFGDTDRLWCIGELSKDKEELKNARDWTRRVNSMYRE